MCGRFPNRFGHPSWYKEIVIKELSQAATTLMPHLKGEQ
jgi:hypothetical protein